MLTVEAFGVIGTLNTVEVPFAKGDELEQFTTVPIVPQLQPLLIKVDGAVTPAGRLIVADKGPEAGAVPTFEIVTGKLLV